MVPAETPQQPLELTPAHLERLRHLLAAGFEPAELPFFSGCVAVKKYGCAALLRPQPEGKFELAAPASWLLAGQLSAKVERGGEEWFVWKAHQVRATPERLEALRQFEMELRGLLESPARPV
jgi:hypothetical protein